MNRQIFSFGTDPYATAEERRERLGGKGAGLADMSRLGIPVPPGFTITLPERGSVAEDLRARTALWDAVRRALADLERQAGRRLGDPVRPLLVAVRSGAPMSMPGMLDTVLDLGLTDETADALARETGDAGFAFDVYRRFIMTYADVVLRLDRAPFERMMESARAGAAAEQGLAPSELGPVELRRRVPDAALGSARLRELVGAFKQEVRRATGAPFPQAPFLQLSRAIEAVFASWHGERAKAYRALHRIPEAGGSACTVQGMVFGNRGERSGTGIVFSRNPVTGDRRLYGEWLPLAQGEDLVSGVRTPWPLVRSADQPGEGEPLEERMPGPFAELAAACSTLERHFHRAQDVEFTIDDGRLFLLQCRPAKCGPRAAVRIAASLVQEGIASRRDGVLQIEPGAVARLSASGADDPALQTVLAWADQERRVAVRARLTRIEDLASTLRQGADGLALELGVLGAGAVDTEEKGSDWPETDRGWMTRLEAIVRALPGAPVAIQLENAPGAAADSLRRARQARAILQVASASARATAVRLELVVPDPASPEEISALRRAVAAELASAPPRSRPAVRVGMSIADPSRAECALAAAAVSDLLILSRPRSVGPWAVSIGELIERARAGHPSLTIGVELELEDDLSLWTACHRAGIDHVLCAAGKLPAARLLTAQLALGEHPPQAGPSSHSTTPHSPETKLSQEMT